MYSPRAGNAADARESEVSYWRLLGLQAAVFYVLLAIALAAGWLSVRDQAFDAALTTIAAIFGGNLFCMPQSHVEQPCFEHCSIKRKRLSNAAYRFSGQWICRRQARLQRYRRNTRRALEAVSIWVGALVAFIDSAVAKLEFWTYGRGCTEIWNSRRCSFFSSKFSARRGPRFRLRICLGISSPALTCRSPGTVALRGIYTLTGKAAVHWHVVGFYRVPAVSVFIAQLAVYCFLGGVFDTAQAICHFGLLLGCELALFFFFVGGGR